MEYQGKELFRRSGIPVPESQHCNTPDEVAAFIEKNPGNWVIKAQVLMGGRGKAGKIKFRRRPTKAARPRPKSWRRRCRRTVRIQMARRSTQLLSKRPSMSH